jgi:DNA repair protein RecO (recombination protein O)
LENTPAILLRKTRFGDTSLIVSWLSPRHGKIKTVVKGALNPKSKFAGVLDLFFLCEVSYLRSSKSEIHTLREAALLEAWQGLRLDYPRVALASYFVELLEMATEPEHADEALFDLMKRALAHLNANAATQRAMLHFESELVRILGIQNPNLSSIVAFGRVHHRIPQARSGLLKMLPER